MSSGVQNHDKKVYLWENPLQKRLANSRRTDTESQIKTVQEELNQVNGEKEAETKERYDKIWKLKNDLDEVERSTEQHKVCVVIKKLLVYFFVANDYGNNERWKAKACS